MSTETIFRQLGRIHDSYTGIGPGKTREEYLNIFSRASYSTQNEWPYSSPFAGFYDVSNSSTRLILLNQRYKYSHLRGQVVPRETSNSPEDSYKKLYESILESELPPPKTKPTHKLHSPRIPIDPYRHFESFLPADETEENLPIDSDMTHRSRRPHTAGSSRRNRTRSLSAPRRSQSATGVRDNNYQTDPSFAESLWQYCSYQFEKSRHPKIGLQQYHMREPSNRLLRQSGIYRNPSLTRGQKLYLLEKCHIYDVEDSKTRHVNSYLQVLSKRYKADLPAYKLDFLCKPEFRLNDPRDFSNYEKFVKTPRPTARPLNTGYFTSKRPHYPRLPGSHKVQQQQFNARSTNSLNKKDFIVTTNPTATNQKLLRGNRPQSSRRLSASSMPIPNENNIHIRFLDDRKEIPKIPVISFKAQN